MGQEPQIELTAGDKPRSTLEPGPARRWKARRPGDLHSPGDVPWSGGFGTPGPDTGYALKLAAGASFELEDGESRRDVENAMVHLMAARASHFGKAPSRQDLRVALLIFGLASEAEVPDVAKAVLARERRRWAPRAARSSAAARALVDQIPIELLVASPDDVRHRLALGESPLSE